MTVDIQLRWPFGESRGQISQTSDSMHTERLMLVGSFIIEFIDSLKQQQPNNQTTKGTISLVVRIILSIPYYHEATTITPFTATPLVSYDGVGSHFGCAPSSVAWIHPRNNQQQRC